MPPLRHLIRTFLVLLFAAFSSVAALAMPTDWHQVSYLDVIEQDEALAVDLAFAARAPPPTSENIAITGAHVHGDGDVRALPRTASLGDLSEFWRFSMLQIGHWEVMPMLASRYSYKEKSTSYSLPVSRRTVIPPQPEPTPRCACLGLSIGIGADGKPSISTPSVSQPAKEEDSGRALATLTPGVLIPNC